MRLIKPQGFALIALLLLVVTAGAFAMSDPPVRVAKTREELKAVSVAERYIATDPRYSDAVGQVPGVSTRFGTWLVTFPPSCSFTGKAGPMIVVTQGAFKIGGATRSHAVCPADGVPWWLRPERDR